MNINYHPVGFEEGTYIRILCEYELFNALADEISEDIDREILEALLLGMQTMNNTAFAKAMVAVGEWS